MKKFKVITAACVIEIEATCVEAAQLEIEDQGRGPVLEVQEIPDAR